MKNKNYPLYETTVFENIRVMVENVAQKYPDRVAISYKINPQDAQTVDVTYSGPQSSPRVGHRPDRHESSG